MIAPAEALRGAIIGSQSVLNCLKETLGKRLLAAYSQSCSAGMF